MSAPGKLSGTWLLMASLLAACAYDPALPRTLEPQIDQSLTFDILRESPATYRGHLIVVGGEVLRAKRLKEGTRIEILEIPLEDNQAPGLNRMASRGRFLALQQTFLDPATVPAGTRVTIVGEVTGATTLPLDETDYTYPTLEIKNIKVWPKAEGYPYWYVPYAGPSYWGPYWHPYRGPPWRRHPYWW